MNSNAISSPAPWIPNNTAIQDHATNMEAEYLNTTRSTSNATPNHANQPLHSAGHPCVSYGVCHKNLINIPTANNKPGMQDVKKGTNKTRLLKMGVLNAHSVKNKSAVLKDTFVEEQLDIVAITETWLQADGHEIEISQLTPNGYTFKHVPRSSGEGGGVGLLYKSSLDVKLTVTNDYKTFEKMECTVNTGTEHIRVLVIYRPPPSPKNKLRTKDFYPELENMLDALHLTSGKLLLCGDINFHMLKINDSATKQIIDMLESRGLQQHVDSPTHRSGHCLDIVATRLDEPLVSDLLVTDHDISDHFLITFHVNTNKPSPVKKQVTYRKLHAIDKDAFKKDIADSVSNINTNDISVAVTEYNTRLSEILDKHAPNQNKTIILRPNAPWYNESIRDAKREKRKHERKWRRTGKDTDKNTYKTQCQTVNELINTTKTQFYSDKIQEHGKDQKALYRIANKLLSRQGEPTYPSHDSVEDLCNRFAQFFVDKIAKIRQNLTSLESETDEQGIANINNPEIKSALASLQPASEEEVRKIIMQSPSKTCDLDPIPTWLVKDCIDELLPVITQVVNISLSTSEMSAELKLALVGPLLKKASMDPEILKHFRPVSNLSFLSKIIEKVVAVRYDEHLVKNGLKEKMQSAYTQHCSTETALLRVQNDILQEIDNNKAVILVLLDLSAAFDTIDHKIMLQRMETRSGIVGSALDWFKSYLTGRSQKVHIFGVSSEPSNLSFGVPQGSVLGPKMYVDYTSPLGAIARKYGLNLHIYADDTQLYLSFSPKSPEELRDTIMKIERCVAEIICWMKKNMLQLNVDKTEILVFGTRHMLSKLGDITVKIGESSIPTSTSARNLGVIFDSTMSLSLHVTAVCKQAYNQIRNIRKIRKYLTVDATKTLVHALVMSKLDYANALLIGLPKVLIKKLQRVQNTAARLITGTKYREHISPVLQCLHWLPVAKRIEYKLLLYVFKSRHNIAPRYLSELIQGYKSQRCLRSEGNLDLIIPRSRLSTFGDRRFAHAAPTLWNKLPLHVKKAETLESFKKLLKTHLFKETFNQ